MRKKSLISLVKYATWTSSSNAFQGRCRMAIRRNLECLVFSFFFSTFLFNCRLAIGFSTWVPLGCSCSWPCSHIFFPSKRVPNGTYLSFWSEHGHGRHIGASTIWGVVRHGWGVNVLFVEPLCFAIRMDRSLKSLWPSWWYNIVCLSMGGAEWQLDLLIMISSLIWVPISNCHLRYACWA